MGKWEKFLIGVIVVETVVFAFAIYGLVNTNLWKGQKDDRRPTPIIFNVTGPRNEMYEVLVEDRINIRTKDIYESGHRLEEISLNRVCPLQGKKLRLLIVIASALRNRKERLAIRQTWGHYNARTDISVVFILGRSLDERLSMALADENYLYGDLIRGNFVDSYNNLTLKMISALEWIDKYCYRVKYILKSDDDVFVNVPKLVRFLDRRLEMKNVIFGRVHKGHTPVRNKKSKYYIPYQQFAGKYFPDFTTGPAYVLSNDIIHKLYVTSLRESFLKLEDVFLTGVVAEKLHIQRINCPMFYNKDGQFRSCCVHRSITVHNVQPFAQYALWNMQVDKTKCYNTTRKIIN